MLSRKLRFWLQVLCVSLSVFLMALPALAQEEDNPNSPTPILLSEPDSTRALTADSYKSVSVGKLSRVRQTGAAFGINQKIRLYVTNISLMSDEGANAFRVYVEDAAGRQYRFPVLEIERVKAESELYALTVLLRDEIGYWEQPSEDGDVLIGVAWRGLISNRLRLGLGKTGGSIKDDAGAAPIPDLKTAAAYAQKFEAGRTDSADYVGYRWSGDRMRFLEQATFGPTQALDDRIRRIGLRTWLAEQFEAPYPSAANPYPNIPLNATNVPLTCNGSENPNSTPVDPPDTTPTCFRDTYSMYVPQTWFYKEAFYGDPQLKHRVSWALSQIWVISGVDTQQSSWLTQYHKMLSKNAFGNWRQLMADMTLNAGMGNYLDMIRNTKNSPNENYAREILQLFNVGLFMLNPDGTRKLDGQGNPIPTYDQTTVNNFTKVFTGWTTCEVTASCPNRSTAGPNYIDPMLLTTTNHDLTQKTLFSYTQINGSPAPSSVIAACANCTNAANINTYALTSLSAALDNIYSHPNVPPFVSKFLIQQLVTSDPTPAYVGRVAAVFEANKYSPTQMKEVIKAILLDPEARGDVKTDPSYGKLREPVLLATNLLRTFNVASADGLTQSDGYINPQTTAMGQNVFTSPTVFNYYPPDYTVPGAGILAPEFGIFTTGTSITRVNFVNTMVSGKINCTGSPACLATGNAPSGTSINLSEMQALAAADTTSNQLLDAINRKMMHNTMSSSMRSSILTAVNTVASTNPLLRAQTAVYLTASSSQYQVQR
jgi:uncharacterized protein (DUF1800 family)